MLIKGVNKRIIEVLNPEDTCFERIILFLSPNCKIDEQLLSKRTAEYVDHVADKTKPSNKRKRKLLQFGELLTAAAAGAALTLIFLQLF